MYTIDASVHVSALNPGESESAASQTLLAVLQQLRIPQVSPTLLLVEVAAAVARVLGDAERAIGLASAIRDLPCQTLVVMDEELADLALRLAAASTTTVPGESRSPERSLHIVTTGKTGSNRHPIPAC